MSGVIYNYKFHIIHPEVGYEVIKELRGNLIPAKIYLEYEEEVKKVAEFAKKLPDAENRPNSCKVYTSKEDMENGNNPIYPSFHKIIQERIGQVTKEPYVVFELTSSSG